MSRSRSFSQAGRRAPFSTMRVSIRLLGWVLAVQPWLAWPPAGLSDPFGAPRWLAGAAGLAACLGLILRESRRANSADPALPVLNPARCLREPFLLGALLIVGGLLLSALASPVPLLGLRVTLREGMLALLAASLAVAGRPTPAEWRWILNCLLLSVALQAMLALCQLAAPDWARAAAPILAPAAGRAAIVGTFGNPEYLAAWLAAGMVAGIVATLRNDAEASPGVRLLAPVAALLALTVVFLGGGRGAILSALAALALWVMACVRLRRDMAGAASPWPWRHLVGLLASGLVPLALLTAVVGRSPRLSQSALPARLASLTAFQSTSMRHRIGLYIVTSRMILDHPLLGCGPGRFGAAFDETLGRLSAEEKGIGFWVLADVLAGSYVGEAHCDPLQWWAEYGLLPVAGLGLMLVVALAGPLRRLRRASGLPAAEALWVALATLSFNLWVSFPLHEPARAVLWWSLLGLLAGLAMARDARAPDRAPDASP